jgi:hypothetical protein
MGENGGEGQPRAHIMDVNMVFIIPEEFHAPEKEVATLALGAERAIFEKPIETGKHKKLLFIRGHLDGAPMGRMLFDGGASVNIMPWTVFERLGHKEKDLKKPNLSLRGFAGESAEAKGIVCKEVTVGSKTIPMAFFVVDVKGRCNVLLGHDWIHANGCVPSTLHQCVVQWDGDQVEVVGADEDTCIAMAETQEDIQEGHMRYLSGHDLTD